MNKKEKPRSRIFIGSSVEKLDIAYAAQENLEHDAEVTVWTQGIFQVSDTTLEALVRALDEFDFAVFVFAADDIVRMRKATSRVVRDNVLFELGLFIGRLGKNRCFLAMPRGTEPFRLPSDLLGITPAQYEPKRQDGNLVAALGAACSKMLRAISKAGPIVRRSPTRVPSKRVASGLSEEFKTELQRTLASQRSYIERVMKRFERRLTSYIQTEEAVEASANPVRRVLTSIAKLSPSAGALLAAITTRHLTLAQYQTLHSFRSTRQAISELRRTDFLIPVRSADESLAYWYPPGAARHIIEAVALMQVHSNLSRRIGRALGDAGYTAFRPNKALRPTKPEGRRHLKGARDGRISARTSPAQP